MAIHQLSKCRVYVVEPPDSSGVLTEHPQPRVLAHPQDIVQLVHQGITSEKGLLMASLSRSQHSSGLKVRTLPRHYMGWVAR
eukprot:4040319-Lingulodinium_polyedra.AAC.1